MLARLKIVAVLQGVWVQLIRVRVVATTMKTMPGRCGAAISYRLSVVYEAVVNPVCRDFGAPRHVHPVDASTSSAAADRVNVTESNRWNAVEATFPCFQLLRVIVQPSVIFCDRQ